MGFRLAGLANFTQPTGPGLLGTIIGGGLDILRTVLERKLPTAQVTPTATPGAFLPGVSVIPRVAGTIAKRIPKGAAGGVLAGIGLGELAEDIFGGGALSDAQQRKVDKFRAYTDAGVPPKIAARAASITKGKRRGITATELSGFNKVVGLLARVGRTPRKLGGGRVSHRVRHRVSHR